MLQSGIKLTNEPPKGLKANITRTYNEVDSKVYDSCTKPTEYKKLLYSLAFFHAVILERRKFGPIGWNIPYEWMNSDFDTCQLQLMMYLDEQPTIPWTTLNYLLAEINYGGRVTDDKDMRLIIALLKNYFCPEVLGEHYDFIPGGIYYAPKELELEQVKDHIKVLPNEDDVMIFGLHSNANITYQQKTVKEFFDTLLMCQPRMSGAGKVAVSDDQIVKKMAEKFLSELPELISEKRDANPNSLQIFRFQEVQQYNVLVKRMKSTLNDLKNAINGTVVMSLSLERMFESFLQKKVPQLWEDKAYPSLKPLLSWFVDLQARVEFYKKWVEIDQMESYWLSGMFFPQGFMTSALQTYARKSLIAIDTLTFKTEVQQYKASNVKAIPENGVNIHGLFIEGCRWDMDDQCLAESHPKVLLDEMPVIWLEPVITDDYRPVNSYKCPLYKTSTRKGVLSTTGHSTNFVMYLDLKSPENTNPMHWVRRGVGLLCQNDD